MGTETGFERVAGTGSGPRRSGPRRSGPGRTGSIGRFAAGCLLLVSTVVGACSDSSDTVASSTTSSPTGSSTTIAGTDSVAPRAPSAEQVCSWLADEDLAAVGLDGGLTSVSPVDPGSDTATGILTVSSACRRSGPEGDNSTVLELRAIPADDSSVFEEVLADPSADDAAEIYGVGERAAYGTDGATSAVVTFAGGRVLVLRSLGAVAVPEEQLIELARLVVARAK